MEKIEGCADRLGWVRGEFAPPPPHNLESLRSTRVRVFYIFFAAGLNILPRGAAVVFAIKALVLTIV